MPQTATLNSQHRQDGAWKLHELRQTGFLLLANVQILAETAFPKEDSQHVVSTSVERGRK